MILEQLPLFEESYDAPVLSTLPLRMVTLWQPWASFVALGLKKWETRGNGISWEKYHGLLAIHAAVRPIRKSEVQAIVEAAPRGAFKGIVWDELPLGEILAVGYMRGSVVMTPKLIRDRTKLERAVGDWHVGRLAIHLDNVVALPQSIDATGGQGLRILHPKIEQQVRDVVGLTGGRA